MEQNRRLLFTDGYSRTAAAPQEITLCIMRPHMAMHKLDFLLVTRIKLISLCLAVPRSSVAGFQSESSTIRWYCCSCAGDHAVRAVVRALGADEPSAAGAVPARVSPAYDQTSSVAS